MHALIFSLLMLLADGSAPADLNGKVVNPDGAPIASAMVVVHSGEPKKGPARQLATEVPDTSKFVTTDAQGAFAIHDVDASMNFELLILADGYRPLILKKVDPARGEILAKLLPQPKESDTDHLVKGHVVDSDGKPVVGACCQVAGGRAAGQTWYGTLPDTETETYTDTRGEFTLISKLLDIQLDVKITGRNVAPQVSIGLSQGEQATDITMTSGATVVGRLMQDGKPVGGMTLKLAPLGDIEAQFGPSTAITGDDGKFTFTHVHPDINFNLYGPMKTMAEHGAVPSRGCSVTADGTTVDVGDVAMEKGFTVSGQLVAIDDKRVPSGAKIQLYGSDDSDTVDVKVGADGKFEFKGVPGGVYYMMVQASGYRLTHDNQSFYDASYLMGNVDDNITDLRIQIEPGSRNDDTGMSMQQMNALRAAKLSGVASP